MRPLHVEPATIRTCAQLCAASYDDKAPGFTTVGDLRYGLVQVAEKTIVVIRGTANAENWLRDADAFPGRSRGGYLAHAGFVDAYRRLCSGGMPTVKGDIIATGHSLGGAIATLLAEHAGCKLITFGSPRVYFRFGGSPVLDHHRFANDDDPVPRIPALLYRHLNPAIILDDKDDGMLDVRDHFMGSYLKRLEAYDGLAG